MKKKVIIAVSISLILFIGYVTTEFITLNAAIRKEEEAYNAQLEAKKNIYVSDTNCTRNGSSSLVSIDFTVCNDSTITADYMEFQIYVYDDNGNMIHSDWANETNIAANTKRVVSTYVDMPTNAATYKVVISDLRFY